MQHPARLCRTTAACRGRRSPRRHCRPRQHSLSQIITRAPDPAVESKYTFLLLLVWLFSSSFGLTCSGEPVCWRVYLGTPFYFSSSFFLPFLLFCTQYQTRFICINRNLNVLPTSFSEGDPKDSGSSRSSSRPQSGTFGGIRALIKKPGFFAM